MGHWLQPNAEPLAIVATFLLKVSAGPLLLQKEKYGFAQSRQIKSSKDPLPPLSVQLNGAVLPEKNA